MLNIKVDGNNMDINANGSGAEIISELCGACESIITKMSDGNKMRKESIVNAFCDTLRHFTDCEEEA